MSDELQETLGKVLRNIHGQHQRTTTVSTLEQYCPECPESIENPEKYYRDRQPGL